VEGGDEVVMLFAGFVVEENALLEGFVDEASVMVPAAAVVPTVSGAATSRAL
jgi:hypothetical protein